MILYSLNLFSNLIASIFRLLAPIILRLRPSEKAQTFLNERKTSHWQKAVLEAKKKTSETFPAAKATYWVHVASAGELEQVIPILRALHEQYSVVFFLTYFSPSAIPFLKNCPGLIGATSLPWENPKHYRFAIEILNIKRLMLVRYDFWPALIYTCLNKSIAICVVAATLKKARSPLPGWLQNGLRKIYFNASDAIFLVDDHEKETLKAGGFKYDNIFVAGDAKWLRAKERALRVQTNQCSAPVEKIKQALISRARHNSCRIVAFGSPHKEEMEILRSLLSQKQFEIIYIVAPQDVDKPTLNELNQMLAGNHIRILKISENEQTQWCEQLQLSDKINVVVLDTFGYLAEAYGLADLAVIGGGFDGQLHNVLEPAAFPVVTLYGNKATRAPEAQILLTKKAAIGFTNPDAMFQFLRRWVNLPSGDTESPDLEQTLAEVRANAASTFASLPDTSEVVCRALSNKDALEAL